MMNLQDYEHGKSPVKHLCFAEQINYWRKRAKFFEQRAYANTEHIRELEDEDDGANWWKKL